MMPQSHIYRRRVEFRDTDAAGIVHFSVFFAYMEQAEHDLWRTLGTSVVHRTESETLSWPRVSAKCDYKVAIRFEDEIDIGVQVKKIGNKSLTFGFDFQRGNDQIAVGEMSTVCCQIEQNRKMNSVPIPDSIRNMLEAYLVD